MLNAILMESTKKIDGEHTQKRVRKQYQCSTQTHSNKGREMQGMKNKTVIKCTRNKSRKWEKGELVEHSHPQMQAEAEKANRKKGEAFNSPSPP